MANACNLMASSPLLQNSPLLNLYSASLAATLMHQTSPLLAPNVFSALACSPLYQQPSPAGKWQAILKRYSTTNLVSVTGTQPSMFSNPLSTLTTPVQRTPATAQQTHQSQFFQFPPPNQASAMAMMASLGSMLSSPGFNSPFLNAMTMGAPSNNLSKISRSPEPLKTPVPTLRDI